MTIFEIHLINVIRIHYGGVIPQCMQDGCSLIVVGSQLFH
jgi:hypothetical protein